MRGERYGEGLSEEFKQAVANLRHFDYEAACKFYTYADLLTKPHRAFLGCNDRFYFLTDLLERKDAIHPWIYKQCRMVEKDPDEFLDLWARYHYKTTIITTAGSLQEICHNPEVTIALFSETKELSGKFLQGLMQAMESNERLKEHYPDVFYAKPRTESPLWAVDKGLVVKRSGLRNEPTLSAWGLFKGGMPTGGHWDILLYNDIITQESVTNQDIVAKVTERFQLSTNLGIGEGTRRRMEGTRYSFADTYGILMERGIVKPRVFAATHNSKEDDYYFDGKGLKQINPVFISLEQWQKVKIEQYGTYAAQMLQNPLAGKNNTFDPKTLRRYMLRPRTLNVYIMGDYASGEKKNKKTDHSCILVVGIDHNGNKYLLDGARYRMTLEQRTDELFRLVKRWRNQTGVQTVSVGYEKYGAHSDIQHFELEMRRRKEYFSIAELNWPREGLGSKAARIQRLQPDFAGSRFFFPAKVWRPNALWWVDRHGKENAGVLPEGYEDGRQMQGARTCIWSVDRDTDRIEYRPMPAIPHIDRETKKFLGYLPRPTLTDAERDAKASGEEYRIVHALQRKDWAEGGNTMYDLTQVVIEEFSLDPFSMHDDAIDTLCRIYDMEPTDAVVLDKNILDDPPTQDY